MNKTLKLSLLFMPIFIFSACSGSINNPEPNSNPSQTQSENREASSESSDMNTEDASSEYVINPEGSVLRWSGQKTLVRTSDHFGTADIKEGKIFFSEGDFVGGEIVVDMTSLESLDQESPEGRERLNKHLKSDDFFDVEKYPEARFKVSQVEKIDEEDYNYLLRGEMEIKGQINEIEFKALIEEKDGLAQAEAEFEIDRTKWGVIYGSGNFFKELGDNVIDDNMAFEIKVTAQKK